MFAALFRILFGLIVAAVIAGCVQVMFALTPAELAVAGQDRWLIAASWALDTAIFSFIFAAPLVLLIGIFGEVLRVRSFAFYLLAGIFVALAGFAALYSNEGPTDPTLANSYAIATYLTTGFVGGLVYWLVSGRFAGGRRKARDEDFVSETVATKTVTTRSADLPSKDGAPPKSAPVAKPAEAKANATAPVGSVPSTA
jgi:hypothetical protein